MKLNQFQKNVLYSIGLRVSTFALNVLLKTATIKTINQGNVQKFLNDQKNFIVVFWHGSMLVGWYLFRNKNFAALVSKSKDGNILASILDKWNFKVVRGSSHIGGSEALDLMVGLVQQKCSLAITPDGPTGPIYKMKAGAVVTAKKTGVPLFLIGIGIKNKFVLKSWDRFEIPKPFTKINVIYSDPIIVESGLDYDSTNKIIVECEEQLNILQKKASFND
jgi:lysophospholipid acyltransferase (LPLAT)-like uncharacterized protein